MSKILTAGGRQSQSIQLLLLFVLTKKNSNLLQASKSIPSIDKAECDVDEVYEGLCRIDPVALTRFLVAL